MEGVDLYRRPRIVGDVGPQRSGWKGEWGRTRYDVPVSTRLFVKLRTPLVFNSVKSWGSDSSGGAGEGS